MFTLLDRVRALVKANINWMLDQAMKVDSTAVIDQYIRKVEGHLEDLEEACVTIGDSAKTFQCKFKEYQTASDREDQAVDELLKAGKDTLAKVALSQAKIHKRTADMYRGQAAAIERLHQNLQTARVTLQVKLKLVEEQRADLLVLLDLARAKKVDVKTFKSIRDLSTLNHPDIDRVVDRIYARLDQATGAVEVGDERDLNTKMMDYVGDARDKAEIRARKVLLGLIPAEIGQTNILQE